MAKATNAGIIYSGASVIDGAPIVVILIGSSSNKKTGNIAQTFIIRSDVDPITANRTGLDRSVCGDCKLRGTADPGKASGLAKDRTCYVQLGQSVMAVYNKFKRGGYPVLNDRDLHRILKNKIPRIGSYGDGAAVPSSLWEMAASYSQGVTAYTHQGTSTSPYYMISADTLEQAQAAWSEGRRTFRIVSDYSERKLNEVVCPSDRGVKCEDCGLCDGSRLAKSVVIQVHGAGSRAYREQIAA